jgi:peptide-methionine (R)-S-oxide reductase
MVRKSSSDLQATRRQFLLSGIALCASVTLGRQVVAAESQPGTVTIEKFSPAGVSEGKVEVARVIASDAEWRQRLSADAYRIARRAGTERPNSGEYVHNTARGIYRCICCDTALFDSRTQFDSGTGWPSFWKPISRLNVVEKSDSSFFMQRTAVECRRCDAHLGHVFEDGPQPTGLRYCMNSVALKFAAMV